MNTKKTFDLAGVFTNALSTHRNQIHEDCFSKLGRNRESRAKSAELYTGAWEHGALLRSESGIKYPPHPCDGLLIKVAKMTSTL